MAGGRIIFKNQVTNAELSQGIGPNEMAIGFTTDGEFKISEEGASASNIISSGLTEIKISLTQSQIIGLSSSPVLAIPSPGVGKAIFVDSLCAKMTYGTTQYDGGADIRVKCGTLTDYQLVVTILSATFSKFAKGNAPFLSGSQLAENDAIYLQTTADATVGDSTVDVYLTYHTITL